MPLGQPLATRQRPEILGAALVDPGGGWQEAPGDLELRPGESGEG